MNLDELFDHVKDTGVRHVVIHLDANSKHEYQRKINRLYRLADELQKALRLRSLLWMKQKNVPEKFAQVWELAVVDPRAFRSNAEVVFY